MKEHQIANLLSTQYLAINESGMCTLDLIILLSLVAGKDMGLLR